MGRKTQHYKHNTHTSPQTHTGMAWQCNAWYTPTHKCGVCGTDAAGHDKPNGDFHSIARQDWALHIAGREHLDRVQRRNVPLVLGGRPLQQEGNGEWRYQCLLCALTPEGTPRGPNRLRYHAMHIHQLAAHWASWNHLARNDGRVQLYLAGPQPRPPLFEPHVLPGYGGAQVVLNMPVGFALQQPPAPQPAAPQPAAPQPAAPQPAAP